MTDVLYEGKLLVQRYRVKDHYKRNKYASFCNALQMPGFFHIHPGAMAKVNPPRQNHYRCCPSLYDYFGLSIKKPHDMSIDPSSRFVNFIELSQRTSTMEDHSVSRSDNYLSSWLQIFQEQNPSFFFIQTNLVLKSKEGRTSSWTQMEHYVPVIKKGDYYYICPGEETALVYRVLHFTELFFTTDGHNVLHAILGQSFGGDGYSVGGIALKVARPEWSVCNLWDEINMYDIEELSQFPVTSKSSFPDNFHTAVQVVDLNDDKNIEDVSMKYYDSDEEEIDSEDNSEE